MLSLKSSIESPLDYLRYLREILSAALSPQTDKEFLKRALVHARRNAYGEDLQLGSALLCLSSHLLGAAHGSVLPRQYPNGAALSQAGAVPDLLVLAELGVLWGALGVIEKRKEFCTACVKLANWQSHLIDHQGRLLQGVWAKSSHYPELLAYHSLLFSLAHAFSGEEKFQRSAAAIRPHLKTIEIPALAKQISQLLQGYQATPEKVQLSPFLEESMLGMAKAMGRNWTAIGAVSGYNTGLGAFHKDEAACVTFGPLLRPLDELSGFGIERICSMSERTFADLTWEKSHQGFFLKGWTKVFASPLWIEMSLGVANGEMRIKIEKEEERGWGDLSFAFFVSADEVEVDGSKMKALSLDRFAGNAQRISFKGLTLETPQNQPLEVVPLAGGDHFWGADFLVAFSLEDNTDLYEWIIK